jgi:hypothetical protein
MLYWCVVSVVLQNGVVDKYMEYARKNVGSTEWSKASSHFPGPGTWKCNVFVADMVKEAGGRVPQM